MTGGLRRDDGIVMFIVWSERPIAIRVVAAGTWGREQLAAFACDRWEFAQPIQQLVAGELRKTFRSEVKGDSDMPDDERIINLLRRSGPTVSRRIGAEMRVSLASTHRRLAELV